MLVLCYQSCSEGQGPRAVRSVLVRYSMHQKGYKLYDLDSRSFFVSRDVVFMESTFPFQGNLEDHQPSFNHFSYDDLTLNPIPATLVPEVSLIPSAQGNEVVYDAVT